MAQEKWIVSGPKTIELDHIDELKVSLVGGTVDVIAHDEPGARIEVHSVSGRDLKITTDGGLLEIDHPQLRWDNFIEVFKSFVGKASADVSIAVPRGTRLRFGVVNATALVSGLAAPASVSTVNGDVTVADHEGELKLNSVNGELSVQGHRGRLVVNTVSGDVTAAGEVTRASIDGVSGAVFLDLDGVPEQVDVNNVSGDVTIRLAADAPSRATVSGVWSSVRLDGDTTQISRGRTTSTFGKLDGHWTELRVNTVSGDVSVLHAVRA